MGGIKQWFLSQWGKRRRVSARSGKKTYFPTLDGWRALSVMAVIFYHGRFDFFSDSSYMQRVSAHGDIGVDVFFAISGFLISSLLLQEFQRTGHINLRAFYLRRFFRIVPAYYLALATISILGILKLVPMNSGDLLSCLFFYRNYRPLGMDLSGGFYTAHFWSLAIEEHFYILWPTLLLLVRPKRIGTVSVLFAIAVFGWRQIEAHYHFGAALLPQLYLTTRTDTRIDSLLWACVAAIYFPAIKGLFESVPVSELWLPFAAVIVAVGAFHVPGTEVILAVILPLLVLSTVVKPDSIFSRLLDSAPLRWIGALSYSLYLWQELFLPEVSSIRAQGVLGNLQHAPWNLIAILTCACLSHYLLENPMNRLGHRLSAATLRPAEDAPVITGGLTPLGL